MSVVETLISGGFTGSGLSSSSQILGRHTHNQITSVIVYVVKHKHWDSGAELFSCVWDSKVLNGSDPRLWCFPSASHSVSVFGVSLTGVKHWETQRGRVTKTLLLSYWNRRERRKVWSISLFHTHTWLVRITLCVFVEFWGKPVELL